MAVGYSCRGWRGIGKRQAIAIGMEIGIHNGTLAIAIALSPRCSTTRTMAIPRRSTA